MHFSPLRKGDAERCPLSFLQNSPSEILLAALFGCNQHNITFYVTKGYHYRINLSSVVGLKAFYCLACELRWKLLNP